MTTIEELAQIARKRKYPVPAIVTEADRQWLTELVGTCPKCGHPAERIGKSGKCRNCQKTRPVEINHDRA